MSIKYTSNPEADQARTRAAGINPVIILPRDPPICYTRAWLDSFTTSAAGQGVTQTACTVRGFLIPVPETYHNCTRGKLKTSEIHCTINHGFQSMFSSRNTSALLFPASGCCPAWQTQGEALRHPSLHMRGYMFNS